MKISILSNAPYRRKNQTKYCYRKEKWQDFKDLIARESRVNVKVNETVYIHRKYRMMLSWQAAKEYISHDQQISK